jgi:hypothetical protein
VSLPAAVLCRQCTLSATVLYSTPCSLCFCVFLGHLSNRGSFPSKDKTSVFSSAVEARRIKGTLPAGIKWPGHKTNFMCMKYGGRECVEIHLHFLIVFTARRFARQTSNLTSAKKLGRLININLLRSGVVTVIL